MLPEILEVSDGTEFVSLLNDRSGFVLDEWDPKEAQFKEGGVYKDSSLSDGRSPVMIRYENVEETFSVRVTGCSQNVLIRNIRRLRALLNKGINYWLNTYSYEPVWLRVKGRDEAYARYSVITGFSFDGETSPFHPPVGGTLASRSTIENFEIIIEHLPFWYPTQPGTDTAIEAGVTQTYDGRTLGNVDTTGTADPTTAAEVFFANKSNIAQLTDVYRDDGGVFSANLLDSIPGAYPYSLLPAIPQGNDAAYFGIDTTVANSGPFSNLIFDLAAVLTNGSGIWEYWNGAWVVFPTPGGWTYLADNTQGLTVSGVNGVFWDPPADWTTTIINGVTGWWVRFRVTGAAGATGPTQQNRNVYTCNWPYIEIQSDQIESEMPALMRMIIRNESNYDDDTLRRKFTNRLICGARGVDRGSNFDAYIPLADTQLISGQTISFGAFTSYANNVQQNARGRIIRLTQSDVITVTLDNTIANDYKGRFHVYLRYIGTRDWTIQLRCRAYGDVWLSDLIGCEGSSFPKLMDLGSVTLPPSGAENNETIDEIELNILCDEVTPTANDLDLHELILIPADEWIGSFFSSDLYGPNLDGTTYLDANSVTFPKKPVYSPVFNRSSGNLESQYTNTNIGTINLEQGRQMRLWFLALGDELIFSTPYWFVKMTYVHNIQLSMAGRYLGAIGESL